MPGGAGPAWAGGYVADSTYRIAFQAAQTPSHLAVVCAMAGIAWRPRERMHIADLGCGRGYTVNLLAAANPDWTVLGLDHNPVHVAEGMQTAAQAGLGNALFQEADLALMSDAELELIPPLDVVMLHGVWSWVSDAVREGVVRLLARRLKPGGLLYVGYNALPGAGVDLALQRLLRHLAGPITGGAGSAAAAASLAMERLRAMAPALKLHPSAMLARLLAEPPGLEPAFAAHEFLTEHWRPIFHEDLCAALLPAKLEFVGSSNLFEAMPALYCQGPELTLLEALPAGTPRELLKDLCLPRGFRADVFIRGARKQDAVAAMDSVILAATRTLPEESPSLGMGRAQAAMAQPVWEALVGALAGRAQCVGALRAALGPGAPHGRELLALLLGTEYAMPVYRGRGTAAAASRFNRTAAAIHAEGGAGRGHFALASPVAAGGLAASAFELTLVNALLEGADADDPGELARQLRPEAPPDALDRAADQVAATLAERMPVWQRFGIL